MDADPKPYTTSPGIYDEQSYFGLLSGLELYLDRFKAFRVSKNRMMRSLDPGVFYTTGPSMIPPFGEQLFRQSPTP